MIINTRGAWGGMNQNTDGVVKVHLLLPYSEIAASVKTALLVDKELELKVCAENSALTFPKVTFYNLTLKKDGNAKVTFLSFKEDMPALTVATLNELIEKALTVDITERGQGD